MFFRKSQPGPGKRKSKPQQQSASSPKPPAKKPRRRLDAVILQYRPPEPPRRSASPRSPQQRGAPLSPATQWLLEKMSRLSNLDNYGVLKDSFIAIYLADPTHHPASAERAFYSAVQTCKRRLRR